MVETTRINLVEEFNRNVPHIMKYMGSKRSILEFVVSGINEVYNEQQLICDLFAGSSILSGSLANVCQIHSNDIQEYSGHIARTYLSNYDWASYPDVNELLDLAKKRVINFKKKHPELKFEYSHKTSLSKFNKLEAKQQELKNFNFKEKEYFLFTKYYSGTYWSFEQCLWIDSLKQVADKYKNSNLYFPIISSLMYAMSYCSQSTGHVAQYRVANDIESMQDILTYRIKKISFYFKKKFLELSLNLRKNEFNHNVTTLSFEECLDRLPNNTLVYADPPYCFVHYSRFYHAFETLIKYDYPEIKFKGRYRTDRHQSPFSQRSEVRNAFKTMFEKIYSKNSQMVLSYSNTGMISLEDIVEIMTLCFDSTYNINVKSMKHEHSTMGRVGNKSNEVEEYLIIAKKIL